MGRRLNSTARATASTDPGTDGPLAQVLRRRTRQPFCAFGVNFVVCDLSDGWSAVACASGRSSGAPTETGSDDLDQSAAADWRETLQSIHESFVSNSEQRLHKYSHSGQVAELQIGWPAGNELTVICKQGSVDRLSQRIGTWIKGPKEWREFWLGHRLRQLGLPTPLPLACMWRPAGLCHLEGRIVTEFLNGAHPLDRAVRMIDARRHRNQRSAALDTLTSRLAEILGTLGNNGLYHRDLKVSNVLVSNSKSDPQPWLIDLDGVAMERQPQGPRFRRTLVRLTASLTQSTQMSTAQYVRALRRILAASDRSNTAWKSVWSEIALAVDRMSDK